MDALVVLFLARVTGMEQIVITNIQNSRHNIQMHLKTAHIKLGAYNTHNGVHERKESL